MRHMPTQQRRIARKSTLCTVGDINRDFSHISNLPQFWDSIFRLLLRLYRVVEDVELKHYALNLVIKLDTAAQSSSCITLADWVAEN